ncbi:hypothetical protein [Nesterenkonia sp. NBAIMH1]|uniref:hypothetical protein n=1 Tax=Nesterenkonia sp. NBAIMH1 TaxID=2600320 RepID=UPI0011B83B13|nr:hypothetical protein [Nesterenkonia sp. NBAIMH1]
MSVRARVTKIVFDELERHPDGMQWADLLRAIQAEGPEIHPKTANGIVWKLVEDHPESVHKPARGRFQLLKYANRPEGSPSNGSD